MFVGGFLGLLWVCDCCRVCGRVAVFGYLSFEVVFMFGLLLLLLWRIEFVGGIWDMFGLVYGLG